MSDPLFEGEHPKGGRILVVDDDPRVVDILKRFVLGEGYSCWSAMNGAEALQLLARTPVDVILLDVAMPGMGGLEVCRRIRTDEALRRIPVILLTGLDDMETRQEGMRLGVSEYLTKPINRQELFRRIRAQMHTVEIDRQLSTTNRALSDGSKA